MIIIFIIITIICIVVVATLISVFVQIALLCHLFDVAYGSANQ